MKRHVFFELFKPRAAPTLVAWPPVELTADCVSRAQVRQARVLSKLPTAYDEFSTILSHVCGDVEIISFILEPSSLLWLLLGCYPEMDLHRPHTLPQCVKRRSSLNPCSTCTPTAAELSRAPF